MPTIIDLGKLRFQFRGAYSNSTEYEANDVVKYGANLYVYTSGLKSTGNTPSSGSIYWDLMIEGFKFEGVFDSATTYNIGDGFSYGGTVYVTLKNSVSGMYPTGSSDSNYSTFIDGLQFESDYVATTAYQKNDIVTYGGKSYIAINDLPGGIVGQLPTNSSYWRKFSEGTEFKGAYSGGNVYKPGDVVQQGGNLYISQDSQPPADSIGTGGWTQFSEGLSFKDSYNPATNYYKNEVVTLGGNLYKADRDNIKGLQPDSDGILWKALARAQNYRGDYDNTKTYNINDTVSWGGAYYQAINTTTGNYPELSTNSWTKMSSGLQSRGDWSTGTLYYKDDIVIRGGSNYIATARHTAATTFDSDSASWQAFNRGSRFRGSYDSSAVYLKDDVVQYSTSSYIAIADSFNSSGNFTSELSASKWQIYAAGGSSVLPSLAGAGDKGKFVSSPDGTTLAWAYPGATQNVYYVATDGEDDSNIGSTIDAAWKTVNFAMSMVTGPATVYIKEGTYSENLPITVPANVTVRGDGQRNTVIEPLVGDSQETMFYLNNGVLMEDLMFKGLTGFALDSSNGEPDNIEKATIGGVYLRLDPAAVITKSPYIKECSAFSTGGVGALIDGGLNSNAYNNGSMIFHTYTQIHNGGAGFFVRRKGKAEIVSCFTYYCDFGFATSGGAKIRALNCNNSYGTYGSMAGGYDSTETVITGNVRGAQLNYDGNTLVGADFEAGKFLTGIAESGSVTHITRASNGVITSPAHGIVSGQRIQFTAGNFSQRSSDSAGNRGKGAGHSHNNRGALAQGQSWGMTYDSTATYIAQAIDSNTFRLFTDSALTTGINTSLAGFGYDSNAGITDILRQNPMRFTLNNQSFLNDSYTQISVSGVSGTTQVNNQWYAVDQTVGNFVYLRASEHNDIRVRRMADRKTYMSGTIGGTTYTFGGSAVTALTMYKGSRYRFFIDSANAIAATDVNTSGANGGRLTFGQGPNTGSWTNGAGPADFVTGVSIASPIDPSSTRVYNNRLSFTADSAGSGAKADSGAEGLIVYTGNTPVGTTYLHFDSADSAAQNVITVTMGTPPTIDASSYTVYSTGGTAFFNDSGEMFDSAKWTSIAPSAYIVNSQVSQSKVYITDIVHPGFKDNQFIKDSSGAVSATTLSSNAVTGQKGFIVALKNVDSVPKPGISLSFYGDSADKSYVVQTVSNYESAGGNVVLTLAQEKITASDSNTAATMRYGYSQVRLTGHDFLSIGTGGIVTTNYPGLPTQNASQGNEVIEKAPGRVYYVSTDQDGNFRVGNYFRIDQATGRATLDASAFDLSGLTSLKLGSIGAQIGETINEFSSDGTMSGNSNTAVPTEAAVRTFVRATGSDVATKGIFTGVYDSGQSTYYHDSFGSGSYKLGFLDSTRDSGGPLVKSYDVGGHSITNMVYDSVGVLQSFTESVTIGTITKTQNVNITYDSNAGVKTITVS